jgi:four helix bundle protein
MQDLKARTKRFTVDGLKFGASLPKREDVIIVARQFMRSSSSVGANCRSACRGKSKNDFVAKMGIVEEEADESAFWLEVLEEIGFAQSTELRRLKQEANELCAIAVASKKTARGKNDD